MKAQALPGAELQGAGLPLGQQPALPGTLTFLQLMMVEQQGPVGLLEPQGQQEEGMVSSLLPTTAQRGQPS